MTEIDDKRKQRLYYLIPEFLIFLLTFIVILSGDQSANVNSYLWWLMGVNLGIWAVKIYFLQCTDTNRRLETTQWINYCIMFSQGAAVAILFTLSYTSWGKDYEGKDIGEWFWSSGKPWLEQITGYTLGIY